MDNTENQEVAKTTFSADSLAAVSDKATIEIYDPRTKQGTGIKIRVYSRDSDKYRAIVRAQTNRRLKAVNRRIALNITAEENEAEQLEVLVAATDGWEDMFYKGVKLDCTPDNVKMVYTTIPVIREQVEDAINDRGNFMAH